MFDWLPSYDIRRSKRAKSAQIVVKHHNNVEVVLPYRMDLDVERFLIKHKNWICKQLKDIPKGEITFPTELDLKAMENKWDLSYQNLFGRCRLIESPSNNITIIGDFDWPKAKKLLKRWIKAKGDIYLMDWVNAFSIKFDLPYNKLLIKGQKTIWGSCNHNHDITLNYKLLFLSKSLVNYIIIHELCHTRVLNHNKKFWDLVKSFDPDYKEHRQKLNNINELLPMWIEHD